MQPGDVDAAAHIEAMVKRPTDPRSLVEAVEADLRLLEARRPGISRSAEAVLAVALAARIDDEKNSATSVSMNSHEFRETMAVLRALAPEKAKESPLDEIRARRDARVGRGAAATGGAGTGRRRAP